MRRQSFILGFALIATSILAAARTPEQTPAAPFKVVQQITVVLNEKQSESYEIKKVIDQGKPYYLLSYLVRGRERARSFLTVKSFETHYAELARLKKVYQKVQGSQPASLRCGSPVSIEEITDKKKLQFCLVEISQKNKQSFNSILSSFQTTLRR